MRPEMEPAMMAASESALLTALSLSSLVIIGLAENRVALLKLDLRG